MEFAFNRRRKVADNSYREEFPRVGARDDGCNPWALPRGFFCNHPLKGWGLRLVF